MDKVYQFNVATELVVVALPAKLLAVTPWQYVLFETDGILGFVTIVMVWGALLQPLLLAKTDNVPPLVPVVVVIEFVLIPEVMVQELEGNVHV